MFEQSHTTEGEEYRKERALARASLPETCAQMEELLCVCTEEGLLLAYPIQPARSFVSGDIFGVPTDVSKAEDAVAAAAATDSHCNILSGSRQNIEVEDFGTGVLFATAVARAEHPNDLEAMINSFVLKSCMAATLLASRGLDDRGGDTPGLPYE